MDDDKHYNVILTGRLRPQHRRADVVAAIARLYRVDPARIERTFARAPRVIKPAVSRRKATKYLLALGRAGAEVVIEPVASAALPMSASAVALVSRAVGDPGATGSPTARADRAPDPKLAPEFAPATVTPVTPPVPPPGATNPTPNVPPTVLRDRNFRFQLRAATNPTPKVPSVETNAIHPESALLSEPDSLQLDDGRGGGRARRSVPPLMILTAAVALVLGIGAGGWYLLFVGEPTTSLPAPTAATASGERATSVSSVPATATDAEYGPDADPVASVAPDRPVRGRSAEHDTLSEALAAPADPGPAPAVSIASLPARSNTTAAASNTTGVTPNDGLSALDLAAPFGLRMGESIEQLPGVAEPIATDRYRLSAVPQPLADFTGFGVRIGPDRGLCAVWADGVVVNTAANGIALRAAFDAMESALSNRVGPAARTDVLLAASPLTAPDAWMQALERQQRYLFSIWSELTGARLPADVRRVTLRAGAESEAAGRVTLEIAFRSEAACDATSGTP